MKRLTIYYALVLVTVTQYSCHLIDSKRAVVSEAIKETSVVTNDSILSGRLISFYINHKEIPQVCKDLFRNTRQPSDEVDVLALLDSVFTSNDKTRPFYFLTITRTMTKADGAYAEPLGMMAKQFVETRTKEFINYFRNESLLTDKDFEEWAKKVAGEIEISSSGREKAELKILKEKMKLDCEKCDKEQTKTINDFVDKVGRYSP
jgi:hypothetical protein